MPVRIEHEQHGATTYLYDGAGSRVKKRVESTGNETYYVNSLFEIRNGGAYVKYVFAGNLRIAMVDSTGTYYYQKDHLGSTAAITKVDAATGDGTIHDQNIGSYLPFGGDRGETRITKTDYAYTGQERDGETGLYNYNARLYDPMLGQFVTPDSIVPDPFDPQMLNRYSYARNNPLSYVDPDGHTPLQFLGAIAIGAAIGGVSSAATGGDIVQGMLTGAISGAIFYGAGSFNDFYSITQKFSGVLTHIAAGAYSGVFSSTISGSDMGMSVLTGGISGGIANFGGMQLTKYGFDSFGEQLVGRVVLGGVSGGISAVIYGGDFGSGFLSGMQTSAIGFFCNHVMHYPSVWKMIKMTLSRYVPDNPVKTSFWSKIFSVTHEVSVLGKGLSWDENDDPGQPTLKALDLGGASMSLNIGYQPGPEDIVGAISFGLGDHLGVSYYFFGNDAQYGGLSINLGLGLGSPIQISGTFPEGTEFRPF